MNIITTNLDQKCPLYHQYSIQNQPQPAYIELDCRGDGELMADWNAEIGNAIPFYYYHGLAVRWGIPSETSGLSLKNLFEDEEFLACCQTILDGFDEEWDGNNFVGRYTDETADAIEKAECIIMNSLESVEVFSAEDWLFYSGSLKEHWNENQTLEEATAELEGWVEYNQMIDGDISEALLYKAKQHVEYEEWGKLYPNHVKTLFDRGEISQQDYDDYMEATK